MDFKKQRHIQNYYEIYKKIFLFLIIKYIFVLLISSILIRQNKITLECGIARTKWIIPKNGKIIKKTIGRNNYLDRYSRAYSEKAWIEYWKLRENKNTGQGLGSSYHISNELKKLITKDFDKIALIHAKFIKRNSAAKPTDPKTYLATLKKLQENGYKTIYVGREKMPEQFNKFDLFDYANSEHANFENDLGLFSIAKLAIIDGSGIAALPVICKTPFLYINSWDSFVYLWSYKLSIFIPTLMKDKNNNKLKIKDIINLIRYSSESGPEIFPEKNYQPIEASETQILNGYLELEELIKNNNKEWSDIQIKIKNLDKGHLSFGETRISDNFIKQNLDII